MNEIKIIGIMIFDRIKEAGKTQKVLSEHANIIKSRLGFHEVNENICSRVGVIILQLAGNADNRNQLIEDLKQIGGIEVKDMTFNY